MENENPPRRTSRRHALTELNDSPELETPKSASPDELIIIQRGPRRKPITWSPYEPNKNNLLVPSQDKTPEKVQEQQHSHRVEINSKLRRRLILTPEKGTDVELGEIIAKKLKSLPNYD